RSGVWLIGAVAGGTSSAGWSSGGGAAGSLAIASAVSAGVAAASSGVRSALQAASASASSATAGIVGFMHPAPDKQADRFCERLLTRRERGGDPSHFRVADTPRQTPLRGQRGGAKCFCSPAQHCW